MTTAAYIFFLALGGLMLYLSKARAESWSYWPGVAIAFAFALGISVGRRYGEIGSVVPTEALVAIMLGLAIAIVLACRYFHFRK